MGTPPEPRVWAHFILSYYTHDWNLDMSCLACLMLGCWSQGPALKPLCPVAAHTLLCLEEGFQLHFVYFIPSHRKQVATRGYLPRPPRQNRLPLG